MWINLDVTASNVAAGLRACGCIVLQVMYLYHPCSNSMPKVVLFSAVYVWVCVFVNATTLELFETSSWNFYGSEIMSEAWTCSKMTAFQHVSKWSNTTVSVRVDPAAVRRRLMSSATFCIHSWSSGAGYAVLNHWLPCLCRRRSTCLEQSSSRSAPIPDIFCFQNTPEVTSVQYILPFSLTVSLIFFCTEPLKPSVLHTPL